MTSRDKVLAYHSVGERVVDEAGSGLYCVSVEDFRSQMKYVADSRKNGTVPIFPNTTITFDDGDVTNYTHAYPILKEFGLKAYFFILVSRVRTPGYMTWDEIKALRDAGMAIGSHGMTHRILTGLNDGEIEHELKESKRVLEEMLGEKVKYISVPRGFYDKRAIKKAKEAGYEAVFTSDAASSGPYKRGRIVVRADWSLERFVKILENGYPLSHKVSRAMIDSAKYILGHAGYDKMRSLVLRGKP